MNVAGRRAAGLDAAFVAELDVYSQSKGRTPSVFVFNPFAEGFIAHGNRFTPIKHQTLLARDLANVPQFLCRAADIVLVPKRPTIEFLSAIKQSGFPLPEFAELKNGHIDPAGNLAQRKLGSLRPWAWGPDSVELLKPLFDAVTCETRAESERFNDKIARLYSTARSAMFLGRVLKHFISTRRREGAESREKAETSWLCTENEVGVAVSTFEEAFDAIAAIRRRGHHRVVAKQALGLAGQNALRFWEPELLPVQKQWLENSLQNGRQVVIEPWLERELDFSIQLEMESRRLKTLRLYGIDQRSQRSNFKGTLRERTLPAACPGTLRLYSKMCRVSLDNFNISTVRFFTARNGIADSVGFVGPIGIDAFVYRVRTGRRLPVEAESWEINPRYTMGRLTVELMKHVCPGCHGLFRLVNLAQLRAEGFVDFSSYARSLSERFPLKLEGEPIPKIREGALCLNEPGQAQVCLATFQVSRHSPELGTPEHRLGAR